MNAPTKFAYDVERLRADFPILAERPYGKPLVYLDNAASAQKPKAVIDRLTHFYEHEYANVHRGLHYLANAATDAYEAARESVRRFLNAGSVDEIVFARSATEAINLVAASYGQRIGEGDEIVLTIMEHHANIVPWHFLRERKGAVLKWVDVADDGSLALESFARAIGPRTKMVAVRFWWTPRRPPFTGQSTFAIGAPISSSSPATSFTAPRGSACSTARRNGSRNCRLSMAAAR